MTEPEVAIAKLQERLEWQSQSLSDLRAENRIAHSEVMSLVKHLDTRISELTDVVRQLKQDQETNDLRWFQHKEWADARGSELADHLSIHHDSAVRSGVWRGQLRFFLGGSGATGLIGAIAAGALWLMGKL